MNSSDDFWNLLKKTQNYISGRFAASLNDQSKNEILKSYIEKYIRDELKNENESNLIILRDRIFNEMTRYGKLTDYLESFDLEEININGWDDVAVTYFGGHMEKIYDCFQSPSHAVDIIKRLLHHSGMIVDNATPMAQGHLPNNARITVLKTPIVDGDREISVSIRILHPYSINKEKLVKTNFATDEMVRFLSSCLRYGVPFVIAGATSSGKTTLLNAVLDTIPSQKRIFTIESGSRELSLVKRKDGRVVNNVVHTLSRPSDNNAFDISQEDLVVASLRFNPDIVCVGEMRDVECYAAVEASLTGHTVVSTVHAGPGSSAHMRIALLCQKRFPIDFSTSIAQAAQAFPIVAYTHKLENNERKIMDISECVTGTNGENEYRCLYRYRIKNNEFVNGKCIVNGYFEKVQNMSSSLKERLVQFGMPEEELSEFICSNI